MPNNWKTYKLSDIGTIARGKSKHRPRDASHLYGGKFPFIQTGDVKGANHRLSSHSQTYSEAGLAQSKLWPKDTMCITIAANIAETTILNYPACFPDSIIGFIADKEKCDIDFVEYLMQHFKKEVQSHSIGSVQDNINLATFERINFLIPPLQEQKSIASILSTIDDKIENNLAINKTLEEMAMALYKHWFVDFGPFQDGEFVESELGRIPKGWEVKTIYDVCDVVYGAAFKSKLFNENKEGFPLIRIRDLKTLKPQYYTLENHPKKTIIKAGDVVAGMDAEFDPYFWLGEDGVLNQRVVHFKPKTNFSRMFIYHSVLPWLKFYAGAKVGTTVIHLGKSDIDNFKITVPVNFKSIKLFNEQAENYLEQIVNNSKENQTLTQLRDTLLPKLISGELRLKEFMN